MFTSSSSEVDTFLDCQRKHYYGFGMGIQRSSMEGALGFGVLGHKVWEAYYRSLQSGSSKDDAYYDAVSAISSEYQTGKYEASAMGIVAQRFPEYIDWYGDDDKLFRVLGVESTFKVAIDSENELAFTVDLLIEYLRGSFRGEVAPLDFKWTYNFWNNTEKDMHPQFPKYVWGLRKLGYPVQRAILDEIRYRDNAVDPFKRSPIPIPVIRADNVMEEHLKAQRQISSLTQLPLREYDEIATMRLNRKGCGNCEFNQICTMKLSGKDISKTLTAFYKERSYGYR